MRVYRHLTANDVHLEPFPFKRELSMEAYLIENEKVLCLDDAAFSSVEIVEAELSLKGGKKSREGDGRIDILATYSQEYIAVVELKLGQLGAQHLRQLEDYLLEREQILQQYPNMLNPDSAPVPKWIGVLVGRTIEADLAQRLRLGYVTHQGIAIAALTIERFRGSDGMVLVATDVYFSPPNSSKDKSRYRFEGRLFGKGRLVLAIVKRFAEANPTMTFAGLEQAFPKECQGSSGVVATAEQANQTYTASGRKRHFLDPEDLIQVRDSLFAVSSQWGIGNIERLIQQARKLGFAVEAVDERSNQATDQF